MGQFDWPIIQWHKILVVYNTGILNTDHTLTGYLCWNFLNELGAIDNIQCTYSEVTLFSLFS